MKTLTMTLTEWARAISNARARERMKCAKEIDALADVYLGKGQEVVAFALQAAAEGLRSDAPEKAQALVQEIVPVAARTVMVGGKERVVSSDLLAQLRDAKPEPMDPVRVTEASDLPPVREYDDFAEGRALVRNRPPRD